MSKPAFSNEKFEATGETKQWFGVTLHRIRAIREIVALGVAVGQLGGWIEKPENLHVSGDAWVSGNAHVSGDARVYGNAHVSDNAWVYGDARVSDNAHVSGDARVSDNARVYGNAHVSGNAWVYGDARVSDNAHVSGDARVSGNAHVSGDARVYGNAHVSGNAWVSGNAHVSGDAWVSGNAHVSGDAWVYGNARVSGNAQKTPIVISGLHWNVTITDYEMSIGCQHHELNRWWKFTDRQIAAMDINATAFWSAHRVAIQAICEASGRPFTKPEAEAAA